MSDRFAMVMGGTGGLGGHLVRELLAQEQYAQVLRVGSTARAWRDTLPDPRGALREAVWQADNTTPDDLLRKLSPLQQGLAPALVINATGYNLIKRTETLRLRELEAAMRINVWTTVTAAQTLLTAVSNSPEPWPRPTLVSVGSNACDGAGAHSLAYVAAKHALTGVTRSLARDMRGRLNVLQVNPPKFSGTRMSTQIDEEQALHRGVSPAEERERQARSSPAGDATLTAAQVASMIAALLAEPDHHKHLHGTIARLGYPS